MRTSSVHYIAPSAISITPNSNSSANDVSVYIARGAKINVHSPGAGIDYVDAQVQTWSLRGRNRRLADIGKPYTIYARLSKTDHQNGYLVFAPKNPNENEWSDKYNYITKDGLSSISNAITSADYWYVRMGDVSLPDNGKRTITIDTGILGTDLYNSNWELSADGLPLQVGIQCTIEGTDAGSTPYVRWDKTVDLAAVLCKGWNSNIISSAHTWSLSRNTGHPNADAAWPDETRAAAFSQSGQIALLHTRGDDDDFCGSMSATFTITAWGTDLELGLVKLATGSVTIMAETVEKYELVLSSLVVNYNPISGAYSPSDGVLVTIRATDQQGNVYKLSRDQISYMGLSAYYSPSDIDATVSLSFADGGNAVGVAVIPVSAFSLQKSMNVRLLNADYHELSSANIAFVKDGEDTREREWIFLRSEMAIDFGGPDSDHPAPHVIEYGEVNPEGAAGAIDDDDNQEGWVPEGWYDEMSGADETYRYEYSSYRDFVHDEELGDHWGTFTRPSIWDRWDAGGASYRCRWTLDGKDVWQLERDENGIICGSLPLVATLLVRKGSEEREAPTTPTTVKLIFDGLSDVFTFNTDVPQFVISETDHNELIPLLNEQGLTGLSMAFVMAGDILTYRLPVVSVTDNETLEQAVEKVGAEIFLSKVNDDLAKGAITYEKLQTLLQGLQIGAKNFVPDILGEGGCLRMRDDGKVELVTDILYARMRAYFDSVVIREYKHESGNRIVSPAQGFNAARIEWIQLVEEEIEGETEGETITVTREVILEQTDDNKSLVDFFRCYWRVDDGEKKAENQFIIGDLAFCEHSDIIDGSLVTKRYWRVVTGRNAGNTTTADGEAWIDLSNAHDANGNPVMTTISWEGQGGTTQTLSVKSFESSTNSYPEVHDDICMLGCVVDTTRQGAIIEYVSGIDAPTYQIYQGLGADASNPYSLSNKNQIGFGYNTSTGRAYLNVYGDFRFGARPNTQGSYIAYNQQTGNLDIKANVTFTNVSEMSQFVKDNQNNYDDSEVKADIALLDATTQGLQKQIDGAIETYYMEGVPALNLPPVVSTEEHPYDNPWLDGTETPEERTKILNSHSGDLYYDKATGHGYRFMFDDENNVYVWGILTDEDVAKALADAAKAQETADGKRTIYSVWGAWVKKNVNTLEVGDLFIPAANTTEGGVTYKANKVYKCTTDGSATFQAADYIDDAQAQAKIDAFVSNTYNPDKINLQSQIDGKAETFRQATDPSLDWYVEEGGEVTLDVRANHVGDLWMDISANGGKKTYIYEDNGESADPRYEWKAQEVPDEVFDEIDGKSTIFGNAINTPPTNYKKDDMWLLPAAATINGVSYKAGEVLSASQDSATYSETHWSKKVRYTDDTKADSILNNKYYKQLAGGTINGLIGEAQDAAAAAAVTADAALLSAAAANTKLTNWADDGKISPTEKLALKNQKADVQKEYAQIITDAAKYSGVSTTAFTTAYNRAITAFDYYTSTDTEDIDIITDEEEDSDATPRYSRIAVYYAARQTILEAITTAAKNYATAQGDKFLNNAVYKAISAALGSKTDIAGGLVLTSMIGMRQNTGTAQEPSYKVWGGISGEYNADVLGGGIAAWYGGDILDKETLTPEQIGTVDPQTGVETGWSTLRWAKSIDRFDGSGYRANGNITWNEQGQITIKNITTLSDSQNTNLLNELATFNKAFKFTTSGEGGATILSIDPQVQFSTLHIGGNTDNYLAATRKWVGDNYISKTWFNNILKIHYKASAEGDDTILSPNNSLPSGAVDISLESVFSFWTNYAISALGQGVDGSHAIGALSDLSDVTISNPVANQILKYNGTHWVNGAAPETYVLPTATANALGGIKIGYSGTGKNYPIVLDSDGKAYVNVPWTDTTYTLAGLMGSSAKGGATQPIYWDGTEFKNTTYTLAKSVPADAKFTDTTYSFSNADATLAWSTRTKIATTGGTDIYVTLPANPNTNTWRNIYLSGTSKVGTATNTKALNFLAGSNIDITYTAAGTGEGQSGSADYFNIEIKAKNVYDSSASRTKNTVLAAPNGSNGAATFRALVAADIPSLAISKITNLQTSLDAKVDLSSTEQTIESTISSLSKGVIEFYRSVSGGYSMVSFANKDADGTKQRLGYLGFQNEKDVPYFRNTSGTNYKLWHEGNDGSDSGLDADKLDGQHGSYYATASSVTTLQGYFTNGVAKSAAKLTTVSKTAWGQTFWTSGGVPTSISGALSSVTNITMSGYIKIGDAYLAYDSDNNAIKLYRLDANNQEIAANFYALGTISALGQGVDGGGGGGQGDVTWALLASSSDTRQIALSHLTTALAGYSTTSHTHTTTIATDSGTNQLTLAYGTKYKITAGGTSFVFTMPSADDTNTWRNIYVAGTEKITTGVNTKGLNFAAGSNVSLSFAAAGTGSGQSGNANYGTLTISATDTTYSAGTGLSLSSGSFSINSTYQSYISHGESAYNSLSNYLPLTGGTLTGNLKVRYANAAIDIINSTYAVGNNQSVNFHTSTSDENSVTMYIRANASNAGSAADGGNNSLNIRNTKGGLYLYSTNGLYFNGNTVLDSSNSSVSKSGETLTVKINGTSQSLTNTTYSANNGVGLSGTTFYNSGVRATTINGNHLRVNTNGTNADLTIPYATSAGNADTLDGYHAIDTSKAWYTLCKSTYQSGDNVGIVWKKIASIVTTANDNIENDFMIEIWCYADQNYASHRHGFFRCTSYGKTSTSIVLSTDAGLEQGGGANLYATIDSNRNIWIGIKAYYTCKTCFRVIQEGTVNTIIKSNWELTRTAPNTTYITNNGALKNYDGTVQKLALPNVNVDYATSAGNAATATKLQTSRTLWGQSFDGTANVSGNLTLNNADYLYGKNAGGTSYILAGVTGDNGFVLGYGTAGAGYSSFLDGNNIYLRYGTSRTVGFYLNSSGNVGIGTTSPSYKLQVNGTFYASGSINSSSNIYTASSDGSFIQIGGARIVWDNTNKALKVIQSDNSTAANFYATGTISALGQGVDGGGGGGQGDVTWALLASSSDTRQIALSHLTTALAGYSTTSHTHTTTIATDSGTNQLTLAYGTKYKITAGGTSFVFTMPSADDTNTWRNIYVAGTQQIGTAVNTKGLNFAAGSNVSLSFTAAGSGTGQNANYGTITINATDTTYSAGTGLSLSGTTFKIKELSSGAWFSGTAYVGGDGVMEVGRYIDFHPTSASTLDYSARIDCGTSTTVRTFTLPDSGGTILTSGNSSVSKSGETLTVKINGTTQSLTNTNTWRGIQDNLTSSTNTTESLSAKQGYLLANGSARDNTKLPLSGGTMSNTNLVTNLNADLLDGWHKDNIQTTGFLTSSKGGLGSYWGKIWDITITNSRYNDHDITFLVSSAFDGKFGIIQMRIRQTGENESGNYTFSKHLRLIAGNIPLSEVKLYCNNSTGKCELWMYVGGQWGVYNVTILKKCGRVAKDYASMGTLYTTDFNTVQTPPSLTDAEICSLTAYTSNINISGNASTATTLQTSRTIWGQSFNGSANVSGNMSNVGNINSNVASTTDWIFSKLDEPIFRVASAGLVISPYDKENGFIAIRTGANNVTTGEKEIRLLSNGNVGIGTASPSYKLHVSGSANATTLYENGTSLANKYLALAGGTVSGVIQPNANSTIDLGANGKAFHYLYVHRIVQCVSICNGTTYAANKLDLPSKSGTIAVTSDLDSYLPLAGGTMTGGITLSNAVYLYGKNTSGTSYILAGLDSSNELLLGYGTAGAGYSSFLDGNNIYLRYGTSRTTGFYLNSSGNVGIGTTSPSYKLHVVGNVCANGNIFVSGAISNTYYMLGGSSSNPFLKLVESTNSKTWYIQGYQGYLYLGVSISSDVRIDSSGNLYSPAGISCLTSTSSSDIRMKDVLSWNVLPAIEQVADAPVIRFLWKHDRTLGKQVGSIAQYWQKVLPEVVATANDERGTLSLNYGVAALVAAITTARKVVDHEKRITELEKERDAWKEAYSFIKNAYEELKLKIA